LARLLLHHQLALLHFLQQLLRSLYSGLFRRRRGRGFFGLRCTLVGAIVCSFFGWGFRSRRIRHRRRSGAIFRRLSSWSIWRLGD
jgi:hypothetical protein